MKYERALRADGFLVIAGVDEVGRGPLAGPVCAAAVILPEKFRHKMLNDSKKLSERQREEIYGDLTADGRILWNCVMVEVDEIDRVNILQATWVAMRRAVDGLPVKPDAALIDGTAVRDFPVHHRALVGGDGLSFSIAAASVIAKVTRDRLMRALAMKHPEYGFDEHKGYGTPRHLEALRRHGPCPVHRRSFEPVAQTYFSFDA
ncbi:MAG: ribonuclease HII [Verrucomicrobiaceae bacterium]|nr:ribonuclease HII [Verrucomicrobiaceae bacterium]